MGIVARLIGVVLLAATWSNVASATPVSLKAGHATYIVDPDTLKIDALTDAGATTPIMPALHDAQTATVIADKLGWSWEDADGRNIHLSVDADALRLTITAKAGEIAWSLPVADTGTWLIPDGEGMVFGASDPFWRKAYAEGHCLGGTTSLSFPAWSYLTQTQAVTYALSDGFQTELCLKDNEGLQARIKHEFKPGAETLELLFALRPPEPLAPALFYRQLLKSRGQLKTFGDKIVPNLPRLFAAPQIYVWGDGRDLEFLDDLRALGIDRLVISYDQDPKTHTKIVGPAYLKKAFSLGYLAGPYDAFENGQPEATADSPASIWDDKLYPSGCLIDRKGQVVAGFANRGCAMSSEAIARHPEAPSPASRYAVHLADGASQVFIDVDAFGEFFDDFSPDHPMTMSRDRQNRFDRLAMGITRYKFVLGSENVTAWSSSVAHYSHGTAQAHVSSVWKIQSDKARFGAWWPANRPAIFFAPLTLTSDEARALFGSADRLPLFEAVFHDSVVSADRWEFGLMKVAGAERQRFARALLYGAPTMWSLDRAELKRVGPWLKAAQDDFKTAHGVQSPDALTGFDWLTSDHLVQQVTYADGRVLIANFGQSTWHKLLADCVRVTLTNKSTNDLCPPTDPAAYSPAPKPTPDRLK
jgi:hypothetical protein